MSNLRAALIFEDDERFVELSPEVLKDLITTMLSEGKKPQEVYDAIIKALETLTFSK